jgi:SPP1 gp7 family putative phage head morphogenesis protein
MIRPRFRAGRIRPVRPQLRARRVLLATMAPWLGATLELLEPSFRASSPWVHRDAPTLTLLQAQEELTLRLGFGLEQLRAQLGEIGDAVQESHGRELREVLGVDPRSLAAKALEIDFASLGAGAQSLVDTFVETSLERYERLRDDYLAAVAEQVSESFAAGERWEDLAVKLEERFGVTQGYAEAVARDEVGRLNGAVNQDRQEDLGITHYIWRTVHDGRVRPEHEERDGATFAWGEPPDDGHPGEAWNCRCYADPILPGDLYRQLELREAA